MRLLLDTCILYDWMMDALADHETVATSQRAGAYVSRLGKAQRAQPAPASQGVSRLGKAQRAQPAPASQGAVGHAALCPTYDRWCSRIGKGVSEPSFSICGTGNPQRARRNPISEVNRKT